MKPNKAEIECIKFALQFYPKPKKSFFTRLFNSDEPEFNAEIYNVSNIKTFYQLWSDFGLRDYGVNYLDRGRFSDVDKRTCISMWCSILYSKKIDIPELEHLLIQKNVEKRKAYSNANPGGRLLTQSPLDEIPEFLDKMYGTYIDEIEQSNNDKSSLKSALQAKLAKGFLELVQYEIENNPMKDTPFIGAQIHHRVVLKAAEIKMTYKNSGLPIDNDEIDNWIDEVTTTVLNQILKY